MARHFSAASPEYHSWLGFGAATAGPLQDSQFRVAKALFLRKDYCGISQQVQHFQIHDASVRTRLCLRSDWCDHCYAKQYTRGADSNDIGNRPSFYIDIPGSLEIVEA